MNYVYLVISTNFDDFEVIGVYDDSNLGVIEAKRLSRADLVEEQEVMADENQRARAMGEPDIYSERDAWIHASTFHVLKMPLNKKLGYIGEDGTGPSFRWGVEVGTDEYNHFKRRFRV